MLKTLAILIGGVTIKGNGVNPSFYTVGIAFERSAESPWPAAQAFAGNLLDLQIAARWGIALDQEHVIGHRSIRASQACPDTSVDFSRLLRPASATGPSRPPSAVKLKTVRSARIRYQLPNTATPVVEICGPNTVIEVVGFTVGERIQGNPYWYATINGNYMWAGATNRPTPTVPV